MNLENYFLRICIWLLFSATILPVWGQSTLYGKLYENEVGGEALANVRVSARGANEVISNSNGSIDLYFDKKEPGDMAILTVQKSNMVVVNREILESVIPASDDKMIKIVMCPSGQRDIYAPKYYRISIETAVKKKYKEEIAKATSDIENLDTDAITRLTNDKNKALAHAEEMAQALAKIDLKEADDRYKKAFSHYTNGEINKVLEVLSDDFLDAELKNAEEMDRKAREKRLQVNKSYMLKGRTLISALQFDEAFEKFDKALVADSSLYDDHMEYGIALMNYGLNKKAHKKFQRAIVLASDDKEKGRAYRFLGNNHFVLENIDLADEASNKALNLLKGINTAQSQREVGYVYKTLGLIKKMGSDFEAAETFYNLAYAIADSLASPDDQRSKSDLASILTNQGTLYKSQQRFEKALSAAQKATQLNRELVAQDSSKYLEELGLSLNNLGIVYFKLGQPANALPQYEEAVAIFQQLYPQKPIHYRRFIAGAIINNSLIYIESDDHQKAIEMLNTGEEAADWLVANQPSVLHSRVLGLIYQNTGYAYAWEKEFDSSLAYYQKALAIRRQLAQQYPKAFQRDAAKTLMDIAYLLQVKLEQMPTAENKDMLTAYVDSTGEALKTCPETPEVAEFKKKQADLKTYSAQADLELLSDINQAEDAFQHESDPKAKDKSLKKWKKLWEEYHTKFPNIGASGMVTTYDKLGVYYMNEGNFEKALEMSIAGTEINPTHRNLLMTRALSSAYENDMPQAEELIKEWGADPFQGSTWKAIMLSKLLDLESKGHTFSQIAPLKTILN